jgi:uncharacterized protein
MRYCVECKYERAGEDDYVCMHSLSSHGADLVMGNWMRLHCRAARAQDGFCGPEGNYWEPSLWKRVNGWFNHNEDDMGTIRPARIEIFQHQNGDWGFRLVAGNGETVVSGEGYTRKQDAVRGVREFKRMVAGADVVEKAAVASDVL